MKAAQKYVEEKNFMRRLFKKPDLDLSVPEDRAIILDLLDGDLSPENLCCDGELRGRALQTKFNFLSKVKKELGA